MSGALLLNKYDVANLQYSNKGWKKEVNLKIIFVVDNLIVITTGRGIWTISISIKNTRKYQSIN